MKSFWGRGRAPSFCSFLFYMERAPVIKAVLYSKLSCRPQKHHTGFLQKEKLNKLTKDLKWSNEDTLSLKSALEPDSVVLFKREKSCWWDIKKIGRRISGKVNDVEEENSSKIVTSVQKEGIRFVYHVLAKTHWPPNGRGRRFRRVEIKHIGAMSASVPKPLEVLYQLCLLLVTGFCTHPIFFLKGYLSSKTKVTTQIKVQQSLWGHRKKVPINRWRI